MKYVHLSTEIMTANQYGCHDPEIKISKNFNENLTLGYRLTGVEVHAFDEGENL